MFPTESGFRTGAKVAQCLLLRGEEREFPSVHAFSHGGACGRRKGSAL